MCSLLPWRVWFPPPISFSRQLLQKQKPDRVQGKFEHRKHQEQTIPGFEQRRKSCGCCW